MGSHLGKQSQPQAAVDGKGAVNKVLYNVCRDYHIVTGLALWDLST